MSLPILTELKKIPRRFVVIVFVLFVICITVFLSFPKIFSPQNKIDYSLRPAPRQTGFALLNENKSQGFNILIGNSQSPRNPEARFEVGKTWLDFALANNYSQETFKKEVQNGKDVVIWKDVLANTDASYQVVSDGLKESIILKNPHPAQKAIADHVPLSLSFDLTTFGVFPRNNIAGKPSTVFLDKNTRQYRFHLEKPYLVDAKGTRYDSLDYELIPLGVSSENSNKKSAFADSLTVSHSNEVAPDLSKPNISQQKQSVKSSVDLGGIAPPRTDLTGQAPHLSRPTPNSVYQKNSGIVYAADYGGLIQDVHALTVGIGDRYTLRLTLPRDWLTDPARAYPVILDPTVTHNTQTAFATGTLNRVKDEGASDASPLLTSSYHELAADINTVGLWHMNEASGNVADSSGNGNTGTPTGTTVVASQAGFGNARSFNGTSDYITMNAPSVSATGSWTYELWVKSTNPASSTYILDRTTATNNLISFLLSSSTLCGQIRYDDGTGLWSPCTSYTAASGQWYYLALIRDYNSNFYFYVNGQLVSSTADSGSKSLTAPIPKLGLHATSGVGLVGAIDEFRVSNIARTPEEIKQDAQRFPYSVYTSPVVDLTQATGWTNLTWLGKGINTGGGETPISTTGLVAQWNFNELSGTTAASGGSCGAACNGTLTTFSNTTGQDVATGTGWTAANARWGAGALMFNGSNNYVAVPNNASLNAYPITISAWFKTSSVSNSPDIINKYVSASYNGYRIGLVSSGQIQFFYFNSSSNYVNYSSTYGSNYADGQWHNVVTTVDSTGGKIYVDGYQIASPTWTGTASAPTTTQELDFGRYNTNGNYFSGVIDTSYIYSRALTAAEILANYQAGNIEFQTRTSADNSTWEAWKPVTGETQITSLDGPYQYNTTDTGLVSYWPMDEASGTNVADAKGTNTGTATGTTIVDGKFGKARSFNGTSDKIIVSNNASLNLSSQGTVEAWVYYQGTGTSNGIIAIKQNTTGTTGAAYSLLVQTSSNKVDFPVATANNAWADYLSNSTLQTNQWYYLVGTYQSGSLNIYINGVLDKNYTTPTGNLITSTSDLHIGHEDSWSNEYFKGKIDEVRVYNTALSAATIFQHWQEGVTGAGAGSGRIGASTDTTTKMEGTGSEKLTLGAPQVDGNTVALWHMEETSGTGAYIKDSTANANNGTPTGTTVVDGFYGKARSFNGTSDLIDANSTFNTPLTNNFTISAWVNPGPTQSAYSNIWGNSGGGCPGGNFCGIGLQQNNTTNNQFYFVWGDASAWQFTSNFTLTANTWQNVVVTKSSTSGTTVYVNGIVVATSIANTNVSPSTYTFKIGQGYAGGSRYFSGSIDEVKISSTVLTAEEIAEAYRAGRDHRVGMTIASTDLSAKTKIPFYVAADRPGRYLEATIGNNPYVNYEPDANTVGLWHLEEQTGSGAYIKDSASTNHGTPTGTTFVQGKIGKARSFNGTSDQILVSSTFSLGTTNTTMEAWVNIPSTSDKGTFIKIGTGASGSGGYGIGVGSGNWDTNGNNLIMLFEYVKWIDTGVALGTGWHHVAMVMDSSGNPNAYLDGQLVGTSTSGAQTPGGSTGIGGYNARFFNGTIDEVRISNSARSAADIRAAYEIGRRTHSINIDFVTSPQAAYSAGTSVTINNPYGTTALTNTLSVGDTLIFKENVNGTETVSQAVVNAITNTAATYGTVTLASAPTFPTGGYSTNAKVFKWQREYFDITGSLGTQRNAVTRITLRDTDGSAGANVWLDDFRYNTNYINSQTPTSFDTTTGIGTYTNTGITSTLNRYFQYRAILSSWDTPVSPQLTSVAVNYVSNTPPNAPTISSPANAATGVSFTPAIVLSATDGQNDYLRYKIQLCTDAGFTANCQTFDQTVSQTGWSGQNAQTGTAYTSGSTATYTVQSALSQNVTYYIRSYAIDPGGTNTWGSVSGTISFTTTGIPNAPSISAPTNGSTANTLTPAIVLSAADGQNDYLRYKIQLCTDAGFTANCQTFDQTVSQTGWSGQNAQTSTAYTSGSTATYTVQSALSQTPTYYIRAYAIDPAGSNTWSSASSSISFFTKPIAFLFGTDGSNNFMIRGSFLAGTPAPTPVLLMTSAGVISNAQLNSSQLISGTFGSNTGGGTFTFPSTVAFSGGSRINDAGGKLQLQAGGGTAGNGGTGSIYFMDSSGNARSRFDTATLAGTYGTFYMGAANTAAADLAEYYVTGDSSISAGDVVSINQPPTTNYQLPTNKGVLYKSTQPYDAKLIGIISTNPGVIMGSIDGSSGNSDKRMLALAGRVPVKIDPSSPPIHIGDFLTSSSKPGYATKAASAGYAVGRALEDWQCSNLTMKQCSNVIDSFVSVSFFDPDIYRLSIQQMTINNIGGNYTLSDSNDNLITKIGTFAEMAVAHVKAGLIETQKVMVGGVEMGDDINNLNRLIDQNQKEIDQLKSRIEILKTKTN